MSDVKLMTELKVDEPELMQELFDKLPANSEFVLNLFAPELYLSYLEEPNFELINNVIEQSKQKGIKLSFGLDIHAPTDEFDICSSVCSFDEEYHRYVYGLLKSLKPEAKKLYLDYCMQFPRAHACNSCIKKFEEQTGQSKVDYQHNVDLMNWQMETNTAIVRKACNILGAEHVNLVHQIPLGDHCGFSLGYDLIKVDFKRLRGKFSGISYSIDSNYVHRDLETHEFNDIINVWQSYNPELPDNPSLIIFGLQRNPEKYGNFFSEILIYKGVHNLLSGVKVGDLLK